MSRRQGYLDALAVERLESNLDYRALQEQRYSELAHLILTWVKADNNDIAWHRNMQGRARVMLYELSRFNSSQELLARLDPAELDQNDHGGHQHSWLHGFIKRLTGN